MANPDKIRATSAALLDAIAAQVEKGASATVILKLAEAYAWVSYPNNAHGGQQQSAS